MLYKEKLFQVLWRPSLANSSLHSTQTGAPPSTAFNRHSSDLHTARDWWREVRNAHVCIYTIKQEVNIGYKPTVWRHSPLYVCRSTVDPVEPSVPRFGARTKRCLLWMDVSPSAVLWELCDWSGVSFQSRSHSVVQALGADRAALK